ncbi:hypothetical protein GCM10010222_14830 [Streptomyces tanashiensis]|nr:hypothetical protein GCM10010222_14830 [Streptomyces tanashiensis]
MVGVPAGLAARLPAQDLVSAAVGDVADLLDVDVHELAGILAFVAAYDVPGRAVEVGQAGRPVAGQDAVDGRGDQAEQLAGNRSAINGVGGG